VALRGAAGWEDDRATNEFKAGGVSGSILDIAPGVTIGDGRRTFAVRGFPPAAQIGTRALGGTAEYRLPVSLPASGYKMLPLFFQRVSASVFGDAATAWCATTNPSATFICPANGYPQDWMASAGAELHVDAAYQYDVPYRFRLGAAAPVMGRKYFGKNDVSVYFAVGLSF
jgi:outer membrane protein assembly factor BamA